MIRRSAQALYVSEDGTDDTYPDFLVQTELSECFGLWVLKKPVPVLGVWGFEPAVDLVGGPFLAPMQWQVTAHLENIPTGSRMARSS
jgi:hypothetical protein